ncbi:metal ABC transporter solute-binding protein, Zn/Mn family [Ohtaekwangia koreensis]|uniref:Manganese/zinc/iron transport system substrate-binding protein n=1 Tax=Ohtaekwangia koreensis TaxID=688867 RepID=A0A1T5M5R8_9BACT|nr:zinc ABC transporter substrate-binding protein [Ohtaekwangia koreensis]SKC83168.1 manganese/zinc/iron transport system substrate-binding protein [Ohtaekwangia koreensis]
MIYIVAKIKSLAKYLSLLAAVALLALTSCSKKQSTEKHDKLVIVTTTGMIKDAVENIVGGHAEVIALMGPGVDPHLYKATQGDVEKLTNADIVFYNGLHLEGKMGEVLEKLGHSKPVIAVASDIPDSLLRAVPGFQGTHDPHIWFNVKLWENAVRTISKTLEQQNPAQATLYATQRDHYIHQLDSLHEVVKVRIAEVPVQQRVLITAHDAFGYFGDAYAIEVKGLQGISTMSEFGVRDVTNLVNFIIARKIKAIFVETSVSKKSIEAVVEGCHDKGWDVKIGGSLFSDAMGNAGTPEGTYIGMVSANVKTIVDSLK